MFPFSLPALLALSSARLILAAPVTTTPIPSGWATASSPCIAEGNGRALTWQSYASSNMTVGSCLAYCDNVNMPLAGLEYSGECFCGGVLASGASLSKTAQCTMPCSGDPTQTCGGPNALSLYVSTKSNAAALSADLTTQTTTLPTGWTSTGCYKEGITGRALDGWAYTSPALNTATCISYCRAKGFSMAGLEYGTECYCDDAFRNGAGATSSSCNMPCSGGPSENCGGPGALQVYSTPTASTISNAYTYTKLSCIQEVSGRALTGSSYTSDSMSIDTCTAYCSSAGFKYAAVEYGRECYCGNTFVNGAGLDKYSSQCSMKCAGNKKQLCGGPNALMVYAS